MVNVKQSFVIKPEKPTPNGALCISDCDQEKGITHAPTVYFYPPSHPLSFKSASETLRNSLSQILVPFYPLAGRLHMLAGGRVSLECNSAGVIFYEAESTAKIQDFKDFAPTPELRSLIPSVDYVNSPLHELPLIVAQLTQLSCGGISLGLGISHILADGTSASHFMAEWARLARGEPLEVPPFLDRTILNAADPPLPPRFKHDRFDPPPLLAGRTDDNEERSKETTIVILHLTKAQVEKLKDMANIGRPEKIRPYSRYEAVAGHLWRSACKARGHVPEQITKIFTAVSIRTRVKIPKGYFGNALMKQTVASPAGELTENPLSFACGRIRESVEMVTEEYVRSALDDIKRQPDLTRFRTFHAVGYSLGTFVGNPNMEITSWLGIPLQGLDFGWGKDVYMGPASLNFDGKCYLLPGRAEEGSVTIPLRFQVAHVDKLLDFFYEELR